MVKLYHGFIYIRFCKNTPKALLSVIKPFLRNTSSNSSQLMTINSWEDRLKVAIRRYEDLFGITKLAEMHDKVLQAQSRVHEIQQKRRKVQEDLMNVQNQLQEIQSRLEKISRADDIFLSVVTKEHELIKQQKQLQSILEICDQTEREEHVALALAINNSQDHERTYREKNKYISLIAGVVGGLIGVMGSSINNWRHRKDIKIFAQDIQNLIESHKLSDRHEDFSHAMSVLSEDQNELLTHKSQYKSIVEQIQNQTHDLLGLMKAQENALSKISKDVELFIAGDKDNIENFYSDIYMKKILQRVDEKLEQHSKSQSFVATLFVSSSIILAAIIYIINKQ